MYYQLPEKSKSFFHSVNGYHFPLKLTGDSIGVLQQFKKKKEHIFNKSCRNFEVNNKKNSPKFFRKKFLKNYIRRISVKIKEQYSTVTTMVNFRQ